MTMFEVRCSKCGATTKGAEELRLYMWAKKHPCHWKALKVSVIEEVAYERSSPMEIWRPDRAWEVE